MKTGKSLTEMAHEIQRQKDAKKDYLAPTSKMRMIVPEVMPKLEMDGVNDFDILSNAHENISLFTKIDKRYYDRMLSDAPELLAQNVNHWFSTLPESRMVRTLDGNVRAMLSPRYRTLDNFDLFNATLTEAIPLMQNGLELASSEVTENRLYLKFTYPRIQMEVKKGDVVQAGVIVANSEIGKGALYVKPWILRLICTNGMISEDGSTKRRHVGRNYSELDEAYELFSDETRQLDDRAFFGKVQDTFRAALNGETLARVVANMQDSTKREITGDVEGAVQVIAKRYAFSENESSLVMNHLFREGDITQYGMAQAITRTAEDLDSYDRATEFEKFGGEVVVLPQVDWAVIGDAEKQDKVRRGRRPRA